MSLGEAYTNQEGQGLNRPVQTGAVRPLLPRLTLMGSLLGLRALPQGSDNNKYSVLVFLGVAGAIAISPLTS